MEVFFGGLSSLFYGVADYLGGEGARRVTPATVVFWSGLFSFPLLVVAALVVGGEATGLDFLIGVLAGLSGSIGLITLFAGLSRRSAAAVAPVTAAVGAAIPVIAAVVIGERPSILAWVGIAIGVPAVLLCGWAPHTEGSAWSGMPYGLLAGAGFGGFSVLIRLTSPESNLLPLITSRMATFLVPLVLAAFGAWRVSPFRAIPRPIVVSNAVLDVSGNVTLVLALRSGSMALASVAASFYPAITVVLARSLKNEAVLRHQALGLALTVASMAAIAVG